MVRLPKQSWGWGWSILLAWGLNSCSASSPSLSISSGSPHGYYSRLAEQISTASHQAVAVKLQNLESQGSVENLQNLLDRRADFALVQLDVASEALKKGQVKAIAVLANDYVQVITRQDLPFKTFADLDNRRVNIGMPRSGVRYTANELLRVDRLNVMANDQSIDESLQLLAAKQLDAVIYVGNVGGSKKLRQKITATANLRLLPLHEGLVNYLTIEEPGAYQAATIPIGAYSSRPSIPDTQILTVVTPTVLITRPDVDAQSIKLITWAILSTARQFSQFYPELEAGDPAALLQRRLTHVHPAAQQVYAEGDPRTALWRYWERNNDLQAGIFLLTGSTLFGLVWQSWRQERSKKLVETTNQRINQLKLMLPENAQAALEGVDDLSQEHRLKFIEGAVTKDIYQEVQQKTQTFADQCRQVLQQQRREFVLSTLLLLDEWQDTVESDPNLALQKLAQIKQRCRELLLSNQVDIEAYIELMELTLMSATAISQTNFQANFQQNVATIVQKTVPAYPIASPNSETNQY